MGKVQKGTPKQKILETSPKALQQNIKEKA